MSSVRHVSNPETISFHNVNYTVETGKRCSIYRLKYFNVPFLKKQDPKQVLFNVSGKFVNGINAILGPSGCGKTSLLDVLADRKDSKGITGRILVNGVLRRATFRYTVGYVAQGDICSQTLTVRENLNFSMNLRFPEELTLEEKNTRVLNVIKELGLESCADTRVGTEFIRGISGGERKRMCIGMELVLSPKILFLDEPTTGLDASTASSVVNCLKELSKRGRTVIFSIHQPRYSIFKTFDTVMFMCKGRCMYQGLTKDVVPYFSKHGHQYESHDNPADYALDALICISQIPQLLMKLDGQYQEIHSEILLPYHEDKNLDNENPLHEQQNKRVKVMRSIKEEIFYVSQRTLRNSLRNPALAFSQILAAIVIGLLVGLLFYDLKKTIEPGVQNRLGAIFFIVISQIFSNVTAVETLIKERALFIHEYVNGYYRIITFFIAKLICDLVPMRVIPSILFSIITYFMIGLTRTPGQFFIFLLTIFMSSLFGSAICFFISATISVFAVALIIVILILVVMMMFSGFIIDLASIFNWLSWIQWISAFRYASNVLTINEFQGLAFCLTNQTNICPLTGESVLDKQTLSFSNPWDLWKHFFALTLMTFVFLILAYIQLIRIKKTK